MCNFLDVAIFQNIFFLFTLWEMFFNNDCAILFLFYSWYFQIARESLTRLRNIHLLVVLFEPARVHVSEFQGLRELQCYKKFALIWKWGKYSIKFFLREELPEKAESFFCLLSCCLFSILAKWHLHEPININIFTAISIQTLSINNDMLQCSFKSKFHVFSNSFDASPIQNVFLATKLFGIR